MGDIARVSPSAESAVSLSVSASASASAASPITGGVGNTESPVVLGIRPKPNDEGFRLIFRQRSDAVIVDADAHSRTSDGLYVVDAPVSTFRIRSGFSASAADRWRRKEPVKLALHPVQERIVQGSVTWSRTLLQLFEATPERFAVDERAGLHWRPFPTRPSPRRPRDSRNVAGYHTAGTGLFPSLSVSSRLVRPAPRPRRSAPEPPSTMVMEPRIIDLAHNVRYAQRSGPR
jgi:hypothetical protein